MTAPPEPIRVLAGVIERGGDLLLCQRPPHKRHGGLWEFPGGKVEPGESDLDALRRELAEELGVEVLEVGPPEHAAQDPGSPFLVVFVPARIRGEPRCIEHTRVEWVAPHLLAARPLAPADRQFVESRGTSAPSQPPERPGSAMGPGPPERS